MSKRWVIVAVAAVFALMALPVIGAIVWAAVDGVQALAPAAQAAATPTPSRAPADLPPEQMDTLIALEGALQSIYDNVGPSIVYIEVRQRVSVGAGSFFFGQPEVPDQFSYGSGSGFVWDTEGHIVTNNHVIEDAERIRVRFTDGTVVEATVVGTDPDSDLAVLQVEADGDLLRPVTMGDSTQVRVGQLAVAIGNPFSLDNTMTVGFVSALGRSLPAATEEDGTSFSIPDIIQTDAPINPGNSGGVLLNRSQEVIGVTTAIISPVRASSGVGFAVPAATVLKVVPSLIETGDYADPWVGISGTTLTSELAEAMGLDEDQRGGLIIDVTPGGPADEAGLQGSARTVTIDGEERRIGGDVIVAIEGDDVREFDDLIAYLSRHTFAGDRITLTVLRDGEQIDVPVTLGERPSGGLQTRTTEATAGAYLGITGVTLTPELATAMRLEEEQAGVLVQQIAANSPADRAGLRGSFRPVIVNGQRFLIGGDVIVAWDGEAIEDAADLEQALAEAGSEDEVTLTILRNGVEREVEVTLEPRSR